MDNDNQMNNNDDNDNGIDNNDGDHNGNVDFGNGDKLDIAEKKVIYLVEIAANVTKLIKMMNLYVKQNVIENVSNSNSGNVNDEGIDAKKLDDEQQNDLAAMDADDSKNDKNNNNKISQEQYKNACDDVLKLSKEFFSILNEIKSILEEESKFNNVSNNELPYQLSSYSSKIQASDTQADLKRIQNNLHQLFTLQLNGEAQPLFVN